ncbi:hypothetical protein BD779DRAFT_1518368, partial [Infundibulicybe gibba]
LLDVCPIPQHELAGRSGHTPAAQVRITSLTFPHFQPPMEFRERVPPIGSGSRGSAERKKVDVVGCRSGGAAAAVSPGGEDEVGSSEDGSDEDDSDDDDSDNSEDEDEDDWEGEDEDEDEDDDDSEDEDEDEEDEEEEEEGEAEIKTSIDEALKVLEKELGTTKGLLRRNTKILYCDASLEAYDEVSTPDPNPSEKDACTRRSGVRSRRFRPT